MSNEPNPYESKSVSSVEVDPSPESAKKQLLPVAVTLLVFSILHIFGGLFFFVFVYNLATSPDVPPASLQTNIVYCMYYAVTMFYSLILATGAITMLRRNSYVWAMAVCVLALIPFLGPCYVLAIPVGIWGIIVLRRPHVRAAFAKM